MPVSDPLDAFKAFQNEVPEAAYFSYRDTARSPNQQRFFDTQFSQVQNRFMGRIGEMMRSGQDASTYNWTDFLPEYFSPGGGAQYDWMQQGPRRAGGSARFNPPLQFNYGSGTRSSGF